MISALESTSTRPYLIRALYEWCTDNGFTPYVAVSVDESVVVPREFVRDGEIVLNISFDATSALKLGNDFIEFKARFSGIARDILVPVGRVMAIYARENGQGMAFPMANGAEANSIGSPLKGVGLKEPSKQGGLSSVPASDDGRKVFNLPAGGKGIETGEDSKDGDLEPPRPPAGGRPSLKRIK